MTDVVSSNTRQVTLRSLEKIYDDGHFLLRVWISREISEVFDEELLGNSDTILIRVTVKHFDAEFSKVTGCWEVYDAVLLKSAGFAHQVVNHKCSFFELNFAAVHRIWLHDLF